MPKLNRVRIINFYYNNDIRQIGDETLSFYGGENALLNLTNGGGKSVLIQLMLQPIIPDYTIQKRTMSSFLKKATYPAYILLEWLLDNPSYKDYLMTGIAIAPKISKDENTENSLNYFTFVSHYQQACDFDLGYVPFAKKEDGRQIILPFEKAREAVRTLANKNSEIFYYSKDDRVSYSRKLSEFRISQEEWKNIIAKMNNDEGGIDELFEKCSTSNKLVDEWVIKTVEKAILSNGEENTQLYELADALVDDTIKNTEYIKDEKILKTYLEEHEKLEQSLEKVCNKIEGFDKAENDLNHFYSLLQIEVSRLDADKEELDYQATELSGELQQINREDESEKYYACLDEMTQAVKEEKEFSETVIWLQEQIHQSEYQIAVQKAAKDYVRYQSIQGELNGLYLQLEVEQGAEDEVNIRIRDLKYSLQHCYADQINVDQLEFEQINRNLEELSKKQQAIQVLLSGIQKSINELSGDMGSIRKDITNFDKQEQEVSESLGVTFARDLLKNMDQKETDSITRRLEHQWLDAKSRENQLQERIGQIKDMLGSCQHRKEVLIKEQSDLEHSYNVFLKQKDDYQKEEEICKEILAKYDILEDILFQREELLRSMNFLQTEKEQRRLGFEIEQNQLLELLTGIKEGQAYIPKVLTELLNRENIQFQTGESYLNELEERKRSAALNKNPLLPFAILMEERSRLKFKQLPFQEAWLRQLIPVFTYENLRSEFQREDAIINIGVHLSLVSSYETRLFEDDKKADYIKYLEDERNGLEQQIEFLKQEVSSLEKNKYILSGFSYDSQYLSRILEAIRKCELQRVEYGKKMKELEQESLLLAKELQEKEIQLEEVGSILEQHKSKQRLFEEFLIKNMEYMENYARYGDLCQEMEKKEKQIGQEQERLNQYTRDKESITLQQNSISWRLQDNKERYLKYQEAREGTLIFGKVSVLENEYSQLTNQLHHSIQSLERAIEDRRLQKERLLETIRDLGLEEEEYASTLFEKGKLEAEKQRHTSLQQEHRVVETQRNGAHDKAIKAEVYFKNAQEKLEAQGITVPLAKHEIKQNYSNRRRIVKSRLGEITEKRNLLNERQVLCNTKAGILTSLIEPDIQKASFSRFLLEDNIDDQFQMLQKSFKDSRQKLEGAKTDFIRLFKKTREHYENVHASITDILASLDSLVNDNIMERITYDKIYFYAEEMAKKREVLGKLLDYYQQKLTVVDDTKRQVITQCLSYAMLIYEDIKLITERSRVRLANKARTTQMLKIGVPTEIDSGAETRMKDYIELTLNTLITYLNNPDNAKDKKYKDKVRNMMATRLLLNQLIGREQIPIHIYKVELNEANSGMKIWEDAMKENSGGEKFVCFFTVASTLISYTREATGKKLRQEAMDGRAMNESKVMIMDNPFARTSSEHLLKAVIDIAKTFHIQLICLSDLSQSSITNRFNLIFSLSVRRRMYSDKEVLYVEKPQINHAGLHEDERLEHVTFHQTYEQVSLFDDMEF